MSDSIYLDGVEHISATEAAHETDLSRDYIGRLCREGRVGGRRVGKQWYVNHASLKNFLIEQQYQKAARREELAQERTREYISSAGETDTAARVVGAASLQARLHGVLSSSEVALPGISAPGASDAALVSAHIPAHVVAAAVDAAHKALALVLALALTFGTYTLVDPSYIGSGLLSLGKTIHHTGAAAAASSLAGSDANAVTDSHSAFERAAMLFSANIDSFVYAVAFPPLRTFSSAVAGRGNSDASITVRIIPYAPQPAAPVVAASTPAPRPAATPAPTIVNRPVVERVVTERVLAEGGISETMLSERLQELDNKLTSQMYMLAHANSTVSQQNYDAIALTNHIDQLVGTAIRNATITGGSISGASISASSFSATDGSFGSLAATDATTTNLVVTGTLTAPALSFTGLDLANSTTTNATTTNLFAQNLSLGSPLAVAYGGTGTTTAPAYGRILVGNSAGGYDLVATSSLGITGGGGAGNPGGAAGQLQFNDYGTFNGSADFTISTTTGEMSVTGGIFSRATITAATSTSLFSTIARFTTAAADTFSSALATITGLTATNATTTNATSTNLYATSFAASTASTTNLRAGSASIGTLTGPLQAVNGAVSASSTISIAFGGTGTSTAPTYGKILLGNANGAYDLVSTSSLGINSGVWGSITGTLSNQTDLQNALNAKFDLSAWYSTTTDQLKEGSTNLYFTPARALAQFIANLSATTSVASITTLPNLSITNSQVSDFATGVNSSIAASTTIPKTYTANTFSALQTFGNASSTLSSSSYASSTVLFAGSATTSSLAITGISSGNILKTGAGGYVMPAVAGTDYVVPASLSSYLALSDWYSTTTDQLKEGSTNLYFTAARATSNFVSNLAATTSVASITTLPSLSLPATQLSGFGVPFYTFFHSTTTDALAEGSTNLYFTSSRATANFISNLAATTSVASITSLPNLSLPSSQVTGLFGYLFPGNATSTAIAFNGGLSGNLTGNVTGALTGNASTATKLQTPRTIAGVSFDGSANISLNNNAITNGAGYQTAANVAGIIAGTTTDALAEGSSHLYWTAARGIASFVSNLAATTSVASITTLPNLSLPSSQVTGLFGYLFPGNATSTLLSFTGGLTSYASTTIGSGTQSGGLTVSGGATTTGSAYVAGALSLGTALSPLYGGTGLASFSTGDLIYADSSNHLTALAAGGSGTVLKIAGGVPTWGTDLTSGGGGGAGAWATTTDSLAIYPTNTSNVVVIGSNATATTNSIFEVAGKSYFSSALGIATTAPGSLLSIGGVANFGAAGSTLYSALSLGTLTATSSFSATGNTTLANATSTGTIFANHLSANSVSFGASATSSFASNGALTLAQALGAASGGTGLSSIASSSLLIGGAGNTWLQIATSSLGLPTFTDISTNIAAAYPFAGTGNSTSTLTQFNAGLTAYASSTIGNGTQTGGLTIAGGATTTGVLTILGTGTSTFAGSLGVTGNIVPSANNTYSLGLPTFMWKDVYIGPGSLYVNGKEVIHDVSNTITFSTDVDQNLKSLTTGAGSITTQASGTGNVNLQTGSGNINLLSTSGNLNIGTTGTGQLNFGTINQGVWHGTLIDVAYGGTGSTTLSGLLKGNGTSGVQTAIAGTDYVAPAALGSYLSLSAWYSTTTDQLKEGSTNLYFTPARALAQFIANLSATTSVASITTLPNLSITNSQVSDFATGVNSYIAASTTIPKTYTANTFSVLQTFGNASSTLFSTGYASSTNAFFGNLSIGNLSGLLKTTGGTVSSAISGTDYLAPSSLSASFPLSYNSGTGAFSFNGLSTSSAAVVGNIPYFSGANTFANVATTSFAAGNSTLTVTGTLGSLIGGSNSTIALNLASANSWTALQTFGNASSTLFSSSYASSTNLFAGFSTTTQATTTSFAISSIASSLLKTAANGAVIPAVAGTDYLTSGTAVTSVQQTYGSAQNGALTLATTSSAANGITSMLSITNAGGTFTFAPSQSGTLTASGGGTGINNPSAAGILLGSYAGGTYQQLATSSLGLLTTDVAEGSNLYYTDARVNSYLSSSTTIPKTYTANTFTNANTFNGQTNLSYASSTGISSSYASTTNLAAGTASISSLTLGALNGFLKATAGAVSTSLISLTSDITGILGVSNGGTGWGAIAAGTLLTGNGTGALATTTIGTGLQLSGGTLSNTGVTSVQQTYGSAQSGALTFATSSTATSNGVTVGSTITNAGGTFTFAPTVSVANIPNGALQNSTISGVSLGSSLSSLSHDSTLSGTSYNGAAAVSDWGLNLANANTWTALQTFANASSTLFSSSYASTTNLYAGSVGIGLSSTPASKLQINAVDGNFLTMGGLSGGAGKQRFLAYQDGTNVQWRVNIASDDTTRDVSADPSYALALDSRSTGSGFSIYRWPATSGTFQELLRLNDSVFLIKDASNNTRFAIDQSTGNVGIGSSSPKSLLSVGTTNGINFSTATTSFSATGGINLAKGCFAIAGTCVGASFGYLFPNNATTTGLGIYASTTIGDGSQAGGLTVSGGATTTGKAYFSNNVGIGTNVPGLVAGAGQYLTISTTTNLQFSALELAGTSNVSNSVLGRIDFFNNNGNSVNARIESGFPLNTAKGYLAFSTNDGSGQTTLKEQMRIFDNGSVGIGTGATTPGAKLEVNGTASSSGLVVSTLSGLLKANGTSAVTAAVAGTDYATPANIAAAYPFTLSGNATSTLTQFNGGLTAFASTTIGNGTQTGGLTVSGTATTSNLVNTAITSAIALYDANHKEGAYTGTSCTNQFVRSLNGSGVATCATVQNADLANSAITINGSSVSLGGSITVSSTTLLANSNTFSGTNTFSNTITGSISGNAGTATKLQTPRTIAGVSFDGSANISLNNNAITNGAGYQTAANVAGIIAGTTTDALAEGSSNLYWTTARGIASFVSNLAATTSVASITTLPNLSLPASQLSGAITIANGGTGTTTGGVTNGVEYYNGSTLTNSSKLTFNGTTLTAANNASIGGISVGRGNGGVASNVALGANTFASNSSGVGNTAIGDYALNGNTSGNTNTAIGNGSLQVNSSGGNNAALGNYALHTATGNNGTAVGYYSLYSATGGSNTALGYQAGYSLTSGAYNIAIGQNVDLPSNTGSQQLNIGNVLYGTGVYNGGSVSSAAVAGGKIGIGTTTPWKTLSVAGDLSVTGGLFDNNASAGSSGYVLQSTGSGFQWVATSTLGFVTDLSGFTTDNLAEGSSNLYWTAARGIASFVSNLAATTSVASITTLPNLSLPSSQVTGLFGYLFPGNATSTLLSFTGGLTSYASTTIGNGTQTGGLTVSGTATSTNQVVTSITSALGLYDAQHKVGAYAGTSCTNQFVRSLNGSGVATCATVQNADLANSAITINGSSVSLGGSITVSSTTLLANSNTFSGTNTFTSTITGSVSGNAGTVTNGVYTTTFNGLFDPRFVTDLAATTSVASITTLPNLSLPSSQVTGLFGYLFPGNATSTLLSFTGGLASYASTTIGNGALNGGLTISGGATTTANAYFASNLGIGASNPLFKLQISQTGNGSLANLVLLDARRAASAAAGDSAGLMFKTGNTGASESNAEIYGIRGSDNASTDLALYAGTTAGDAERVRILGANGNIGIGTTTPWAQLSVFAGGNYAAQAPSTLFAVGSTTAGNSTTTLFAVNSAGLVGIGTGTPVAQLQSIASSQSLLGLLIGNSTYSTAPFNGLGMQVTNAGTALIRGGWGAAQSIVFNDNGGNVGIGTSSPGSLFSIGTTNGINFSTATSTFSSTGGINLTKGCFAINGTCISGGAGSGTVSSGTQGQFAFYSANGSTVSGTSTLFLSTAGNVGIGTTSPFTPFSVSSASSWTGNYAAVNFADSSSVGSGVTLTSTGAGGRTYTLFSSANVSDAGGGKFALYDTTANVNRLVVDASGNMGIGTTSPASLLALAGTSGIFASTTATSTFQGGGINLITAAGNTGCFAINGSCIGNGSFSNTLASGGTATTTFYSGGLVFSDGSKLTQAAGSGSNIIKWDNINFRLGIGTTTPYAALSVGGTVAAQNFNADSASATSTFAGGLSANSGNLVSDFSSGITTISNLAIGSLNFDADSGVIPWTDMVVTSASAAGTPESYSAQIDGNQLLTVYSQSDGSGGIQNTGIGISSTTPGSLFSIGTTNGINFSTATSTFSSTGGINLAKGCFAVNGTCIGGGAASLTGSTGQLAYFSGSNTAVGTSTLFIATNGNVGVGSTTPWAQLSINPNGIPGPAFAVGSSTATLFSITRSGVGTIFDMDLNSTSTIPNNTPYAWTIATSTTAKPLFAVNTTTGSPSVSIGAAGSDVVVGDVGQAANLVFEENAAIKGQGSGRTITIGANSDVINFGVNTGFASTTPWGMVSINPSGVSVPSLVIGSSTATQFMVSSTGNVGIGTTNPRDLIHVVNSASNAGSAILLQDTSATPTVVRVLAVSGANYIESGTTTYAGSYANLNFTNMYAGSTWLTITGSNGAVVPGSNNTQTLGSASLHWDCIYYDATNLGTCTSDQSLKTNIEDFTVATTDSLAAVSVLRPRLFNWKDDPTGPKNYGFIAQEVQQAVPSMVEQDATTSILSVRYGYLPYLTLEALQQLDLNVSAIASTTLGSSNASTTIAQSFATGFFTNLFARITAWLGDAGNGIDKIFAKEIHAQNVYADETHTKTLCVGDDSGETCITKSQLDALLAGAAASQTTAPTSSTTASATLTINGNDPASWQKGTPWSDNLGALFTHNGINETIYSTSTVDTSLAGTTTIDYWGTWYSDPAATSSAQTLHATRTVVVVDPFAASASTTTATSTASTSAEASATTTDTTLATSTPDSTTTATSTTP